MGIVKSFLSFYIFFGRRITFLKVIFFKHNFLNRSLLEYNYLRNLVNKKQMANACQVTLNATLVSCKKKNIKKKQIIRFIDLSKQEVHNCPKLGTDPNHAPPP